MRTNWAEDLTRIVLCGYVRVPAVQEILEKDEDEEMSEVREKIEDKGGREPKQGGQPATVASSWFVFTPTKCRGSVSLCCGDRDTEPLWRCCAPVGVERGCP